MNLPLARTFAALLVGSIALTARAVPITGQINIGGKVILNPGGAAQTLTTATGAQATTGTVNLVSPGGSYPVTLLGDTASYSAFNFALGAQSVTPLWTVTDLGVGGTGFTYTFALQNVTTFNQSFNNIFLAGTGILSSSDPTLQASNGSWTYSINSFDGTATDAFGNFAFESNQGATGAVPDGGSTALLLGGALIALAVAARRKLAA